MIRSMFAAVALVFGIGQADAVGCGGCGKAPAAPACGKCCVADAKGHDHGAKATGGKPAAGHCGMYATCCAATPADKAAEQPAKPDKVKELQEERTAVLKEVVRLTEQGFKGGQVPAEQVIRAKLDLLKSQLDASHTKEDRVRILEETVKQAEALEEAVKRLVELKTAPLADALKAKAFVLETKIALERAKPADKAAEPAKEVKLTGTLVCGKCQLKQTPKCSNVLQVKEGDKVVNYFLDDKGNGESYHEGVCGGDKVENVAVTGTVTEKDGNKTIKPTKVELPKK